MPNKKWFEVVKGVLAAIRDGYANYSTGDKKLWAGYLQEICKTCNQILGIAEKKIEAEQKAEIAAEETPAREILVHRRALYAFRQGQGYYDLGMFEAAIAKFVEVIEIEPDFHLGRLYSGLAFFARNEIELAKHHFRFITMVSNDRAVVPFAYHMLGCCAVREAKYNDGVKYFQETLKILGPCGDSYFNLGCCYYQLGDYDQAIIAFAQVIAEDGEDYEAMDQLANCYRQQFSWHDLKTWRYQAYTRSPSARTMEILAYDHEEMGDFKAALTWYQQLLAREPLSAVAYHGIIWNLIALGCESEACDWLKKGLALFPDHPSLCFMDVWLTSRKEEGKKALSVWHNFKTENEPFWHAVHCRLLQSCGESIQSKSVLERLFDQQHSFAKSFAYYEQGRNAFDVGSFFEATVKFQQAHHQTKQWRDPLFLEGVCHLILGSDQSTLKCWDKIHMLG